MTWYIGYDEGADETVVKWEWEDENEVAETRIDGWKTSMIHGQPGHSDVREAVAEMIQEAGTPERIRMHRDGDYPFEQFDP